MTDSSGLDARWHERSVGELIDYIIEHHHRPQALQCARIRSLCAGASPKLPNETRTLLDKLEMMVADLVEHADKEERVVFPWLRRNGSTAGGPIRVLVKEHAASTSELSCLREQLAACEELPAGLLDEIDTLTRELAVHVQLEDDVLFPRALADGRL